MGQASEIKWSDVRLHNRSDDCWVVINGNVYDLTSFLHKHPGGELLLQAAGMDASGLFLTTHAPKRAERMLQSKEFQAEYYVGRVETTPTSSEFVCEDDPWFSKLKADVYTELKGEALRDHPLHWVEAILGLAVSLWIQYIISTTNYSTSGWSLVMCGLNVVCGLVLAWVGFIVMHSANHGALTSNNTARVVVTFLTDCLGVMPSLGWRFQHNMQHHFETNHPDRDPDITNSVTRLSPQQPIKAFFRFQHVYIQVLTFLVAGVKTQWNYYRLGCTGKGVSSSEPEQQRFKMAFFAFFVSNFILPVACSGGMSCSWGTLGKIIAMYFLRSGAASFTYTHVIMPNHVTFGSQRPTDERRFGRYQVLTSNNYCAGDFWMNELTGGLSHQIEHHLFTSISHVHYPRVAAVVRKACLEAGLPYVNEPSAWKAQVAQYQFLKDLGAGGQKVD